jgi:plasmid stabilization system protein ParE
VVGVEIKKRLEWSKRSQRNVLKIQQYLEELNPSAAVRVMGEIKATAELLMNQPMLGKPWTRARTRKLVLVKYPYCIIYKLTASSVIVLTVAHQSLKQQV